LGRTLDAERGRFDRALFQEELRAARSNRVIGTSLMFENSRVRVYELRVEPGQRAPFHLHDEPYFWTVVDAGRGLQRFDDGTFVIRSYEAGDTTFLDQSPENPLIHDLENVGKTTLRFVTVALRG
jgi:mannose-6-phosphate isomerase-like protein (cupin superfamily)